jgi:chaperonin GroES
VTFRPTRDLCLIDPIEDAAQLPNGFLVPEIAREKSSLGKVIATGPGCRDDNGGRLPMTVKVGDTVLMTQYRASQSFTDAGHEYFVLSERDIIAIVMDGERAA